MMKSKFLILLLALTSFFAEAQHKYTISGFVKDSLNGETLIGATITVRSQAKGISSNQYGFYSITLPEGDYVLVCSHVGYLDRPVALKLNADTKFNFEVLP